MEMKAAGIPTSEQFMQKVYDRASDTYGTVTARDVSIIDAYSKADRGKGGSIKDSTSSRTRELFGCLKVGGK